MRLVIIDLSWQVINIEALEQEIPVIVVGLPRDNTKYGQVMKFPKDMDNVNTL